MSRFYIIQYMSFTAIAALVFAVAVGKPSERTALALGMLFLAGLSPALLPLLPNSVESVLLNLPDKPDEQIAALERVLSHRAIFRPGPQRSARLKLMHFTSIKNNSRRPSRWAERSSRNLVCRLYSSVNFVSR